MKAMKTENGILDSFFSKDLPSCSMDELNYLNDFIEDLKERINTEKLRRILWEESNAKTRCDTVASRCDDDFESSSDESELMSPDDVASSSTKTGKKLRQVNIGARLEAVKIDKIEEADDVDELLDVDDVQHREDVQPMDGVDGVEDSDNDIEFLQQVAQTSLPSRVSLENFADSENIYLALNKVPFPWLDEHAFRTNRTSYMLGCCYDEVLRIWMITEQSQSRIFLVSEDAARPLQVVQKRWIVHPSAIVPLIEGESAAILCCQGADHRRDFSICLFHHTENLKVVYASFEDRKLGLADECRGLAKSVGGNLMTMQTDRQRRAHLRLFDGDGQAKSFVLPNANRPCFMDAHNEIVVITDLGGREQQVFQCRLNDSIWEETQFSVLRRISNPTFPDPMRSLVPQDELENVADSGAFFFVAGARLDANDWILVADARGAAIKLFNADLEFEHRVSTDFPVPFISNWCVNSDGRALMIDLKGKTVHMAQFQCIDKVGKLVVPPILMVSYQDH